MKNNKLTLKELNAKIEALIKSSKKMEGREGPTPSSIQDIKQSKSSMFYLWILTGILGYAHKIPFIKHIITVFGYWYGKTTWWSILVRIRKLFILFNAVIGVLVVFKTTGFTPDLLINNIIMMGQQYIEIFTNFTKFLFKWFVNLFDHKVVPNLPGEPPIIPEDVFKKYPKDKEVLIRNPISQKIDEIFPSLREIYMKPSPNIYINTDPWYKDTSTLFWLAGIVGVIGIGILGYKLYADPSILSNIWFSNNVNPGPSGNSSCPPGLEINDSRNLPGPSSSGIVSSLLSISNKLNPINWFNSSNSSNIARDLFMTQQNNLTTSDLRLYPFTEFNPHDSWLNKLRISWLGETVHEYKIRMMDKEQALSGLQILTNVTNASSGSSTPVPININPGTLSPLPMWTPKIGTVGLGVSNTGLFEATSSYQTLMEKFSSLPTTPTHVPTPLPELNIESVNPNWSEHVINKDEIGKYVDNLKSSDNLSYAKVAAKSFRGLKINSNPVETSNKFNVLEVE